MPEEPKRKKLKHEGLFAAELPDYPRYTRSYPNIGDVKSLGVQPGNGAEFVVTGTEEGYVKIWRKSSSQGELEFVKQFMAHGERHPVVDCKFSANGKYFITISTDKTGKVFDIEGLDMINIIEFGFEPRSVCWVHSGTDMDRIVVSEVESSKIHIYDSQQPDEGAIKVLEGLHKQSVGILEYNVQWDCIISADDVGMIEYWQPREPYEKPKINGMFELKSQTDLYMFRKKKQKIDELVISPDGKKFAVAIGEQAYLFKILTGKLLSVYSDETLKEDDVVFINDPSTPGSVCFDKSSHFLFHTTGRYVRQVTINTGEVSNLFGGKDPVKFSRVALYQGNPNKKTMLTVEMAISDNALIAKSQQQDPLLLGTSGNRLYVFSKLDDESTFSEYHRDIYDANAKKMKNSKDESITRNDDSKEEYYKSVSKVTVHTTMGDIKVMLYPQSAPLAVENFVRLCDTKYYDTTPFHRVIKRFMIQGGDPEGDGTGGESIWGKPFKDEFDDDLRHDKPYRLSMANAGQNTNGSQFFITTEKTPWLDNKHTIFGAVISGFDVVQRIENLPTNKNDRPNDPPTVISTTLEK